MHPDCERILLSENEIAARVKEAGAWLEKKFAGTVPVAVGNLKGSAVFFADLLRAAPLDVEMDFMAVSSYGAGVKTSGVVKILKDLDRLIEGYHVLVVEDILDSGMTLGYLADLLRDRGPASVRIATLLDKPERRQVDIKPDYVGFTIPDEFVVGYGLDYAELYRNLPYVGVLSSSVYEK